MSILKTLLKRPAEVPEDQGPLFSAVREAMTDVRSYARSHGGDIQLKKVTQEGDVYIKMTGACRGCPLAGLTLRHGVEEQLRHLVPGVRKVVQEK